MFVLSSANCLKCGLLSFSKPAFLMNKFSYPRVLSSKL